MDVLTLQNSIKNKMVGNFYIFTGDEIYVRDVYIRKIAECRQVGIVRADSVKDIVIRLHNNSLVSNNNCYVVYNDIEFMQTETAWDKVISMLGNNILILVYPTIDKRLKFSKSFADNTVIFEHMGEDILTKYIQRNISLSDDNCKLLIDICQSDYSRILLEIDKIRQYSDSYPYPYDYNEDFIHLLEDGTIYKPPKDAIFDMVDSVCRGYIQQSFAQYEDCKVIGENTLAILLVLYNNLKQMLQVQSCKDKDIVKITGLTSWIVQQAKSKIGAYSIGELVSALRLIQTIEQKIKTGEIEQDIAIDYILIKILR